MEHVVFYPSAEGGSGFKRVNSLEEAVTFVEHLRNSENITDFSVHTLTPVPLAFRAYYHVEVPTEDAVAAPAEPAEAAPEPVAAEPTAAPEAEVEVPSQGDALDAAAPDDAAATATATATAAADEDRSAEWVAEAAVVEPPVGARPAAAVEEPVVAGAFAEAQPAPQGTEDVVPVPSSKRSMGFFAR